MEPMEENTSLSQEKVVRSCYLLYPTIFVMSLICSPTRSSEMNACIIGCDSFLFCDIQYVFLLLPDLKVGSFPFEKLSQRGWVWRSLVTHWPNLIRYLWWEGEGGGVAIWWWVLWQHGCCLLGQRMTRTKVRRDPAEKMFREGGVDKLCNLEV